MCAMRKNWTHRYGSQSLHRSAAHTVLRLHCHAAFESLSPQRPDTMF